MTKHYILTLDPSAKYEWDRCTVRNPITADRPDFAHLLAEAVGQESGSYLISVEIQVQVLDQTYTESFDRSELPALPQLVALKELAA
ncbi:MAG: hypothetical protein SFW36_22895 [Leptolyngbyaceae cyanobacterium bins.59]|nr:hypothetical protein [Leptolyngbyaceae cyanobacterium bins.59]